MDGSLVRSQHFVSSFTFIRRRQCLRFEVGFRLRADLTQFEVIVLSHAIFFTLPSSSLFATTDSFSQSPLHEFSRHSHFILSFLSNALSRERERERETIHSTSVDRSPLPFVSEHKVMPRTWENLYIWNDCSVSIAWTVGRNLSYPKMVNTLTSL